MGTQKNICDRKLIVLLQHLNKEELDAFDKYLHSPYFNTHKKSMQLLRYLKKYHPHYQLKPSQLFKQLFGKNKAFSDQLLNDVLSKCKTLLEGFLAQRWFEEQDFLPSFALLKSLNEKNAAWFFEKKLAEIQDTHQQQKIKDANYYQASLQLAEVELSYHLLQKNHTANSQLQQQIDQHLTTHFIINKLRYYCVLQNRRSSIAQENWQIAFMPDIMAQLKRHPQNDIPLLAVWQLLALLLTESEEETHYFRLKNYLSIHYAAIAKGELRQLYTAMLTHCTKQAQSGKISYWEETLELYQFMIEKGILLIEGYIQPTLHFQNIVNIGLLLKKYDWTISFIEEYQNILLPQKKDSMIAFCQANCSFYQKKYDASIGALQAFALVDDFNYISHKILLIKCYYKKVYYDALLNLLAAFNAFLYNHQKQLPQTTFFTYKNFILLTKKLLKLQEEKITLSRQSKAQFQAAILLEIKECQPLSQKKWLLEEAKQL